MVVVVNDEWGGSVKRQVYDFISEVGQDGWGQEDEALPSLRIVNLLISFMSFVDRAVEVK